MSLTNEEVPLVGGLGSQIRKNLENFLCLPRVCAYADMPNRPTALGAVRRPVVGVYPVSGCPWLFTCRAP